MFLRTVSEKQVFFTLNVLFAMINHDSYISDLFHSSFQLVGWICFGKCMCTLREISLSVGGWVLIFLDS